MSLSVNDATVGLLARRDYSREQLKSRLLEKGFGMLEVEQVLTKFEQNGLIDDDRFAGQIVRSQIAKGHGEVRIRQYGMQKGLAKQCIETAIEQTECDWYELAKHKAIKKFGEIDGKLEPKERARRIRHLVGQGFSFDQIAYALAYDPYE